MARRHFFAVFGAALLLSVGASGAQISPASLPPAPEDNGDVQADQGMLDVIACLVSVLQGDASKGERACNRVLAVDPTNMDARELLGFAHLLQHRFGAALEDFQPVIAVRPRDPDVLAGYGRALSGLGQFDAAVKAFTAAVLAAPDDAPIWAALCWARGGTGKMLPLALAECGTALQLDPRSSSALDSRGMVELRMRRFSASEADYTASLVADPIQPSAYFGRGLARLWLDLPAAGTADILQARRLDPDIDSMFVTLGILPQQCANDRHCPPHFPPAVKASGYQTAAFQAALEQNDDTPAIEAGRLDIMVNQIALLLNRPPSEDQGSPFQADLAPRLLQTSVRFNALLPFVCPAHLPEAYCIAWHPKLQDVSRPDPTAALDDAYAHVRPVWAALCRTNLEACRIE